MVDRYDAGRRESDAQFAALNLVLSVLWLAACAGYAPRHLQPGQTEADAVNELGPPTGRYTMPDSTQRLSVSIVK